MKLILPIIILLIAGSITAMLVIFKPDAAELTPERPITSVEVIAVQPQSIQLTVSSQGTLLPTIETDLVAEVSGRVIKVSDSFRIGNHFYKGDRLQKRCYRQDRTASKSRQTVRRSVGAGRER